jgi:hypothetical protein
MDNQMDTDEDFCLVGKVVGINLKGLKIFKRIALNSENSIV